MIRHLSLARDLYRRYFDLLSKKSANNFLHLTGVPLRCTPSGESYLDLAISNFLPFIPFFIIQFLHPRTYMEIGKRFLEENSKHKELNGLRAEEYLEKARKMFQEMDLQWDLDELDRIVAYK